ncbi:phosphonoacetaldehyde hydrolase [Enterococcus lemanii]|uniref:Phosphonoacetaldehyde hydrolase n=1 Tax=Enterococcus lemanii TaxID=1159752 RepID=A0ABV9MU87_9ENTE|nr:phosphonoacetaldehyde hydrolase [Enterococcus lemanii]MBM7709085.1 phosphonoacetaldehyde hydrolase [Enterococcus lemanii]
MIRAVIFDWAGTTVDFGCMAPVDAFAQAFAAEGIQVTEAQIRQPMGMKKLDHIQMILQMPNIQKQWHQRFSQEPTSEDIARIYARFEKVLFKDLIQYATVKEDLIETITALRKKAIKIGSTTGYTAEMMRVVAPEAKAQGYQPDALVTPDDVNGKGRPSPEMIYENMRQFGITDCQEVIKVGDTLSDIAEGKNAGVYTIGVIEGSSLAGYSEAAYAKLTQTEKEQVIEKTRQAYLAAGADAVVLRISELIDFVAC